MMFTGNPGVSSCVCCWYFDILVWVFLLPAEGFGVASPFTCWET